jgi:ketosteroid isomerase-like protein
MKSVLALTVLLATLSLCNLTDKSKQGNNSNAAAPTTTQAQNEQPKSEPQKDRVELTVELMKIESVITTASYAGDISTLASYVADDYSGTTVDGKTQNKNQLLASTKPDTITKSWKITDGEIVSADGDSAVLTYIQQQTLKDGRTFHARVTDTFVKRDGRWLVKSEQATLVR